VFWGCGEGAASVRSLAPLVRTRGFGMTPGPSLAKSDREWWVMSEDEVVAAVASERITIWAGADPEFESNSKSKAKSKATDGSVRSTQANSTPGGETYSEAAGGDCGGGVYC